MNLMTARLSAIHWPILILGTMLVLMLASSLGDSATMDELAHIPAGYSYVKFRDFRLNPEHPPLVKALAGAPLLFLDLNYPISDRSWTEDINGQWVQGAKFLYESGNDPEQIIFWARLPMIILTVAFAALFYIWAQSQLGKTAAAIALLLFAFSPTVLAHGRYVTTDIGAAFGFFIGIVTFLRFLEAPNWPRAMIAGIAFGVAELLKFSTFLLIPIYGVLLVCWLLVKTHSAWRAKAKEGLRLILKTGVIWLIGLLLITLIYGYFTANYPETRQRADSEFLLSSFGNHALVAAENQLLQYPITRPLAHYFLGLLMVIQRSSGGNLNYFLGEVSNAGSRLYFPLLYLLKEPLPLHILTLVALAAGIRRAGENGRWRMQNARRWIENHFTLFAAGFFIFFYWAYTIRLPLNIGIRHVLPTLPFIYLLVSYGIARWLGRKGFAAPSSLWEVLASLYKTYLAPLPRYVFAGVMLVWLVVGAIAAFPHFLPYYNALASGTAGGYRVAVDSNYDWGQDLKRLASYVKENGIEKIYFEYFGGGSPRHYLGDRFVEWKSEKGAPPPGSYVAVSATLLQGAVNPAAPNFQRRPQDSYEWLKGLEPVGRAGYSIFIYRIL